MIPGLSLEVNLWDPMTSYAENGYILSSAISIKYLVKKAPHGYSKAKIQEIYGKYAGSEKERNEETVAAVESGDAIQPTNIICIMNESLSDLAVDGDFTTNIDYFPFLNNLTENTVKGKLCMPVFGAMTSNSEFEFLVGDSMYMMPRGSVAYQFYVNRVSAQWSARCRIRDTQRLPCTLIRRKTGTDASATRTWDSMNFWISVRMKDGMNFEIISVT